MYNAELKALRNELSMLEKSSFTSVKSDMTVLERDLTSLQQKFRDELGRATNTISIELNSHKVGVLSGACLRRSGELIPRGWAHAHASQSQAREVMKVQDRRIQSMSNKLQAEISQLRTAIEVNKLDIVKLSAGACRSSMQATAEHAVER